MTQLRQTLIVVIVIRTGETPALTLGPRLTPGPRLTLVNQIRDTVVAEQSIRNEALATVQQRTPTHMSDVMWGRIVQREPKLLSARYDNIH